MSLSVWSSTRRAVRSWLARLEFRMALDGEAALAGELITMNYERAST